MKSKVFTQVAHRSGVSGIVAAVGVTLLLAWTTDAQTAGRQVLQGYVPAAAARLLPLGNLPGTNRLNLAIGLPLRNQAALTRLLQELYNPASPNCHHYLTPEEFTERFGPTEQDYQTVIAFAKANGLTVTATHPNRVLVDVNGPVADIERALHVTLREYRHPTEQRQFHAPDVEPSLDLTVPILNVSGLDDYALPRPRLQATLEANGPNASPNVGSGPGGAYMGKDFRAAYVPDTTLNGSGQMVGLLQFDGYTASDITYYESQAGLPSVTLSNVLIDGASGHPSGSGGEVEVSLDIEMAISMATNLSKVVVYMAPNPSPFVDLLSRMANDNVAKQLSCSWYVPNGAAEPAADQIFQQMAAQGQSFFNASGDYDAYTGLIDFPGDTPYITQVGGTTLTTSGPRGAWVSETVWNRGNGIGSGGGISTQYGIPDWQTNISMVANQGSTTKRNTPDVALTAENVYVRANGRNYTVGGTSCAAPLWAGFGALVNQQAIGTGKPTVGFVNPLVDMIGSGANYTQAFHDITTGNNTSPSSPSRFYAVSGYDLCTGWGTPAGQKLINALANPEALGITPASGFSSIGGAGGPFTVTAQSLSLTNVGTNSLTWTLVNTSLWLNASPGGGTLTAGGPATTVTVSLNTAASNLVVGTYSATLWFTNLTSGLGQSRQYNLSVISPPTITQQPVGQAVLEGATATFTVGVTGGQPMYYQWQANGTNLTDGGNISGSTTTNLVISDVSAANVGTYSITVSNLAGVAVSSNASLTITPSPPVVIQQPASQMVVVGRTAQFTITVHGNMPLFYQWNFGETNIDGATNATLTLTNVQFNQAGNYAVLVTNLYGSTNSANAVLTVVPCTPAPSGLIGWWPGEGSGNDIIGTNNGILENVTFTNGVVGQAFHLNGSNADVQIPYSTSLQPTNVTVEAWVKLDALASPVAAYAGLQYIVFKKNSRGGNFEGYDLEKNRVNGQDVFRFQVTSSGGQQVPAASTTIAQAGVWYYLAGTYDGTTVKLYVNGVLEGSAVAGFPLDYGTRPVFIGTTGEGWDGKVQGTVDEVSIYNRALSSNEIATIYSAGSGGKCPPTPTPPSITIQPTNQTVVVGSTVNFTVAASGTPPLSYQWSFDGTNIFGTTNAMLTLTNVQMSQSGNYAVLVTNLYGSAISSNAVLVVLTFPPTITTQPTNKTVVAGQTATFMVGASGTPPLSYQWKFDRTNILGATNTMLTLSNVEPTQAGNYAVLVTNLYGSTTSSNAVLTVLTLPPNIITQPMNQTVVVGQTVTFMVGASGTPPLSYQWNFNGTNIVGGTNASLTLTNVQFNQAGNYAVLVTNLYGSTNSANAVLTVVPCTPAPSGLIGWWPGEGSGNDIIGTNNGILENVTFTNGVVGQAFHLNGSNADVQIPYSTSLQPTNVTVEAWVKLDALASPVAAYAGLQYIVFKKNSRGGNFEGYDLEKNRVNGQDVFRFQVTSSGGQQVPAASTTIAQAGVWYYLAGTYDGTTVKLYVNGVLEGSAVAGFPLDYGTRPVFIGTTGEGWDGKVQGTVDEVSIYNRALSSNEIATIYSAGSGGKCPPTPTPPSITIQPTNQTVVVGSTVNFTVAASGTPPLSYQWSFDGTNIFGTTNAMLTLTNVQMSQSGNYAVLVTNLYGSAISSNAVLAVGIGPTIISQPVSVSVALGCAATFSVYAEGIVPLSYQWELSGTNLVGATNTSLTLANVQTSDFGSYRVVVANLFGSVTSSPALLALGHSPVAGADTVYRFAAGGVRVNGSVLLANDTDVDGDSLTIIEVSSSSSAGGTVGLTNNWIYYAPPAGVTNTGAIDTFTYVVSDGHCGSDVGAVTVQVRPDNPQPVTFAVANPGDGTVRLTFDGIPGYTYRLEYTEDLSNPNWQTLATPLADGFGVCQLVDDSLTNTPTRFYRAVWP